MLEATETGQPALLGRVATILQPHNTFAESLTMRQEASSMRGYAVRLPLPNVLVSAMEAPAARHAMRLTVYPSPRGVLMLCLTLQVDGVQLRTVANLAQAGIADWVEQVARTGVAQWFVEIEETGQVAWLQRSLTGACPKTLRELATKSPRLSIIEEAMELIEVLDAMAESAETSSLLPGKDVATVVFAAVAATGHRESDSVLH